MNYRLKQTDYDGTFTYSKNVSVYLGESVNDILLYPNPVTANKLYTRLDNDRIENGIVTISINDLSGRKVYHKDFDNSFSGNILEIDLSEEIDAGAYLVEVKTATGNLRKMIIVK